MPKLSSAINWIAENDEPTSLDPVEIADQISVLLVADLWKSDPRELADLIVARRLNYA
jgi:hypothetical protein